MIMAFVYGRRLNIAVLNEEHDCTACTALKNILTVHSVIMT